MPEVNFIYPRLLGEECKPIIIRDAGKALHFEPISVSEKLSHLDL
jgi:hypothetical protein